MLEGAAATKAIMTMDLLSFAMAVDTIITMMVVCMAFIDERGQ